MNGSAFWAEFVLQKLKNQAGFHTLLISNFVLNLFKKLYLE